MTIEQFKVQIDAYAEKSATEWEFGRNKGAAETRAALISDYRALTEQKDAAEARVAELERRLAAATEVLRELEWSGFSEYTGSPFCPICEANQGKPHHKKCKLGTFISAQPAPAQETER